MQEKTLEELLFEFGENYYDIKDWIGDDEYRANKVLRNEEILALISSREEKAREEGRKEVTKIYWSEEKVLNIQHDAITQYKEELLEKIKLMEITSQTERSLDEAVKTTWNNALSVVKKLI
jgi:DNA polymerase III delta prime subunit